MAKLSTDPYKGVRDFYPQDQFIQNHIFAVWRKTLESFGFVEYGASILEPSELYRAKSGDEIVNEQTYTFKDRGDRDVTLRPEITPTVARMVAGKRRELGFPLRWYSIPNLFRYEAPQRGRLREHWQLNADIFGLSTIEADIEIISIAYHMMKNFGAKDEDFEIQINDRQLIENHLIAQGVDADKIQDARRLIDRKKKIPNFTEEMQKLVGKEIDLNMFPTPDVNAILSALERMGITNVRFEPTLVRGLDYYSGTVFELFDTHPDNPRALFGGGRYDNLISIFSEDIVPAVGFGAGDVTMRDFLETHGLLPEYRSTTDLLLVLKQGGGEQTVIDFYTLADTLREAGINVATDASLRDNGDLYKMAERNAIAHISFADTDTLESGTLIIKNMHTREEHKVNPTDQHELRNILKQ